MIKKIFSKLYVLFFRLLGWNIHRQNIYDGIYVMPTHTSLWDAPVGLSLILNNQTNPLTFLTELWYDKAPRLFRALKFFRTPDQKKSGNLSYISFFKKLKKEIRKQYINPKALCLAICPEGQLEYCEHWQGSFLYLSRFLKLPIYIVKIDYKNKEAAVVNPDSGINSIDLSDEEVMQKISELVDPNWARWPENVGKIELKK